MKISTNKTFKGLLKEYNLHEDLNFSIPLPSEVQKILSDKIIVNEFGIGLENINVPTRVTSYNEDLSNHFHVDWYVRDGIEKDAFELGVKTLIELAKRFERENIKNVQLTYSFQSPEMGKVWAREELGFEEDEVYISDRLSFHKKRVGELVVTEDIFNTKHWAFLLIDL